MYYVTFLANDRKIRTFKVAGYLARAISIGLTREGLHHVVTGPIYNGPACDAPYCGEEGVPCDACQLELTR